MLEIDLTVTSQGRTGAAKAILMSGLAFQFKNA